MLVIACPHALGLAVPLVTAISTTLAAKNGLLVRQRMALEAARNIDVILFDKTGTLTKGEQGVVDERGERQDPHVESRCCTRARIRTPNCESYFPVCTRSYVPEIHTTDFSALSGRGVRATINGKSVYIGGPRILEVLN